ncbi:MFS transporter [Inquilinus limosus]|uniref:MFS transporter n=1 Tax=Inquilinus limosus TaxID=171674 RepID=A0A211ZUF8_9PROT|nr:MFS transporter [Inquilinus limosus]OWJ68834.1 MFS transporter [Inquilinus limosus]
MQTAHSEDPSKVIERSARTLQKRSLVGASLAHALHDGYTDALYAFLPIWQAQFGLGYAALAVVRALYYGTMGGFQILADRALRAVSPRAALVLSTILAASGLAIMALPFGFAGLCVGLVVAGIGSSIQHPRGPMLVTDSYGRAARGPLGIYNFARDLGKAALPALVAAPLPIFAWRPLLGMIGALDTATRMGYLLFLPFLIHGQGGGSPMVGIALALLFVGGALGKATCGWLGERLGVVSSVMVTEAATALLIVATLFTLLMPTFILLLVLGIMLNGTSSVLYGTVPELSDGDTGRVFATFYTSVIGSGGIAPILYGLIADHSTRTIGMLASAATAALIIPLVPTPRPHLRVSTAGS